MRTASALPTGPALQLDPDDLDPLPSKLTRVEKRPARVRHATVGLEQPDVNDAARGTRRRWRRPLLVGVAYACQELKEVLAEPWDVRLDMILTENGLIRF